MSSYKMDTKRMAKLINSLPANLFGIEIPKVTDKNVEEVYDGLPVLTKKNLMQHQFAAEANDNVIVEMTTGTTGVPLRCPKSRTERNDLALTLWRNRRQLIMVP